MKILHLIRHGDYDYRDIGSEILGQGLTDLGMKQAKATARYFLERGHGNLRIISSDYLRAQQTAHVLADTLTDGVLHLDADLRECADVYYQDFPHANQRAQNAYLRYLGPKISGEVSVTLLVCHANVIRYFLAKIECYSVLQWEECELDNGSISTIEYPSSGTHAVPWVGYTGHLGSALG